MSTNGMKMQFLSVVGLKSSTLIALIALIVILIKILICTQKLETLIFVCPLWIQSSIMVSGTQIYFTLFLALSAKS